MLARFACQDTVQSGVFVKVTNVITQPVGLPVPIVTSPSVSVPIIDGLVPQDPKLGGAAALTN